MANLAELLCAVEDRGPSESGAFVFDDADTVRGSVFVETGRVAWAAAPGRSRRLRDLLQRHAERPHAGRELDQAFADCRDAGRPLGELLVERGLVSDDGLRAALKQHTVESLIVQCNGTPEPVTWVPHRHRGYLARHTFAAVELLAAAGAQLYPKESAGAGDDALAQLPTVSAGSFAIGDDDLPVAVWSSGSASWCVRDLLELGGWAAAALSACNGFSTAVMQRAMDGATGATAIAWRTHRRLIHAAIIQEPTVLKRGVASLSQRGLPTVLTSRVPTRQ